ncbi:TIGR02594 family protein [Antarcticirhabdus aurantiaca]|uniref:TIGR02594 family protein n=1 Tax=Antarcticirhabdus aurantiaca TaxID=2606717 RepID=A0ACD4NRL6_9HYPH|nr:TIGR02594 family protein [Jeongeuplla avenae]
MDPQIKAVQERLVALGYDVGRAGADGVLGRDTIGAVKRFQAAAKLGVKWPGTIGPSTLAALNATPISGVPGQALPPIVDEVIATPVWIGEARRFLGKHERRDAKELDKVLGLDASDIAWCGAFVAMVLAIVLPEERMPSNPLGARNWLKAGINLDGPQVGAIVVFWRGAKSGWSGHVGFVVGHDRTHVHVLGGNQSDSVSIARIGKDRLLGYRWPTTGGEPPIGALATSTINASITTNEA